MALQLDVQAIAEQLLQPLEQMDRRRRLTGRQQAAEAAAGTARESEQPVGMAFQLVERQGAQRAGLEVEMRPAHQPHQVAIARLALDQQRQPVGRGQLAGRGDAALLFPADAEVAADDRLDAGLGGIL